MDVPETLEHEVVLATSTLFELKIVTRQLATPEISTSSKVQVTIPVEEL